MNWRPLGLLRAKKETRASLTATVEGLRSELHTTLEIVDLVASG